MNDTIQAYFDLCEGESRGAIAEEAVAVATSSVAIVRERLAKGFATELEVRRATAQLAATRAGVPEAEPSRAVAAHKLAVLVGSLPDASLHGKPPVEFDLPPRVPAGVPAELLERRPDIRAAEARLSGSNAQIGAVIGEFFPQLTVFGFYGNATLMDLKTISNAASNFFIAGPSLKLPIFQGGLTYAKLLEARAHRDELAAQVNDLARSVDLAQRQYAAGFVTLLEVLDAERVLLEARQALLHAQREILGDVVSLQRALGGGWRELEESAR